MKSLPSIFAGIALCVLLVMSFGIDLKHFSVGGSVDLRNRVTGARLLRLDHDPYHYKWKMPDSPLLCDVYNTPSLPVSKVTVTPTLLMLNVPLSGLPYRTSQAVWLMVEWVLLLGTGLLWLCVIPTVRLRWLWAAVVVGFTYTAAWRLHADRAQAYVVMLFLLAAWMWITRHPRFGNGLWGGLLAGFLIALRPPLLLLLGPVVILRQRGQILGAAAGIILGVGLPLLWNTSCWSDYQSAMQTWSELYRSGNSNPRTTPQQYPVTIEGMPLDQLARFSRIPFADSSVFALLSTCGISHVPALPVALALGALIAFWFWHSRSQPLTTLLLGIAAWSFLVDFFLPAYRYNYNDVMALNVLALVLIAGNRLPCFVWPLLAACPLGWFVMGTVPRTAWIIHLPTIAMVATAVWILLLPVLDRTEPRPAATAE